MSDMATCWTCLSSDRRTFGIDTVSAAYNLLVGVKPPGEPRVCWECHAILNKIILFNSQVAAATNILASYSERKYCLSRLGKTLKHKYDREYEHNLETNLDLFDDIDDNDSCGDSNETAADAQSSMDTHKQIKSEPSATGEISSKSELKPQMSLLKTEVLKNISKKEPIILKRLSGRPKCLPPRPKHKTSRTVEEQLPEPNKVFTAEPVSDFKCSMPQHKEEPEQLLNPLKQTQKKIQLKKSLKQLKELLNGNKEVLQLCKDSKRKIFDKSKTKCLSTKEKVSIQLKSENKNKIKPSTDMISDIIQENGVKTEPATKLAKGLVPKKNQHYPFPTGRYKSDLDIETLEKMNPADRFSGIRRFHLIEIMFLETARKVERFTGTLEDVESWRKKNAHYIREGVSCEACVVRIYKGDSLDEHIRLYHSEAAGPHVCDICSRHFRTEEEQGAHYQRHFNMYRCRLGDCEFASPSIPNILRHVKMQERGTRKSVKSQNIKCDICGNVFTSAAYFKIHYKRHVSKEVYQCHYCDRVYNERVQIIRHLYSHERRFMCDQCGFKAPDSSRLRLHGLTHKGEEARQFECTECHKRFTTNTKLLAHMNMHKGIKFLCAYCEKMYSDEYQLNHHVKKAHPDKHVQKFKRIKSTLPYTRGVFRHSQMPYKRNRRLTGKAKERQKQVESSEPPRCEICHKEFRNRVQLRLHSYVHKERPHSCDECGKGFMTERSLGIHVVSHRGERPYACTSCPKAYATYSGLKFHENLHNGKKFECSVCGMKLLYQSNLKRHMQKHAPDNEYDGGKDAPENEYGVKDAPLEVGRYDVAVPGNSGGDTGWSRGKVPWMNEDDERSKGISAFSRL